MLFYPLIYSALLLSPPNVTIPYSHMLDTVRYMARRANFARGRTFLLCGRRKRRCPTWSKPTMTQKPLLPIQVSEEKCVLTRDIGKVSGGVSHFAILFLNGTDAAKSSIQCKRAAERTKGRRVQNPTKRDERLSNL